MYGATQNWLNNHDANSTFNEACSGTFVIQDTRLEYGVDAQPSGQQIGGSVSCINPSANISVDTSTVHFVNITYLGSPLPALNILGDLAYGKVIGQRLNAIAGTFQNATFLWFTITDGAIPNAMEVPRVASNASTAAAASLFIGLCEHTITFSNLPQNDTPGDGIQYINPSQPTVYFPQDPNISNWIAWSGVINITQENPIMMYAWRWSSGTHFWNGGL